MGALIIRAKPLMPDWVEAPDGQSIVFLDDDGSYLGRAVKEYGPAYEMTTGEWVNWYWMPVDESEIDTVVTTVGSLPAASRSGGVEATGSFQLKGIAGSCR